MNYDESFGWSILFSRLFAFRPVVSKQGDQLIASSDWRSQVLSLGFAGRTITIDPGQRVIRILIRRGWVFSSSRRIEFDWISEVLYSYNDLSTGWGAHREQDLYAVGLQLKNGESLTLFRFFGEGDFVNNSVLPDWMYWGDQLIAEYTRGPQERESLMFADLVSRLIGVPISNPAP